MTNQKQMWSENLHYKGIVIEDTDYHIWGSSPIWGKDGRLHVFSSRIPVSTGFDTWWATSEIAHYIADQPEGPFSLVEVLLKPGQTPAGSWDTGTQHNPAITDFAPCGANVNGGPGTACYLFEIMATNQ